MIWQVHAVRAYGTQGGISVSLFKPIWESNNPDKIRKFIANSHSMNESDQTKLSKIALLCDFHELRSTAIKRMRDSELKVSTMMQAKKNGDMETVQALLDSGNSYIQRCVLKSEDLELISLLALKEKTLSEWNKNRAEYEPLLNTPGFDRAKAHYNELKEIDNEEKRAIARQKRQETEKKKHDEFLRDPQAGLIKAAGKPAEKKLWAEWLAFQFNDSPEQLYWKLTHEFKDLNWFKYFPKEYLRKAILDSSESYTDNYFFRTEDAQRDLNIFLQTLYEQREELREEILALNAATFYSGRAGGGKQMIDDWWIYWDPLPPYRLSVFTAEDKLQIHLDEMQKE